jgi:hypothetical protein
MDAWETLSSGSLPPNRPNDELAHLLDDPFVAVVGKDSAGNSFTLKKDVNILINVEYTGMANNLAEYRFLNAFAQSSFVTLYPPKISKEMSSRTIISTQRQINEISRYSSDKEDLIADFFNKSKIFMPDFIEEMDSYIEYGNKRSVHVWKNYSSTASGRTINYGIAHFGLVPRETTDMERAIKIMQDAVYMTVRAPENLEYLLENIVTPHYLDGQELDNSAGKKKFEFAINSNQSLRVIYEARSSTQIGDGCIKMTGYWETPPEGGQPVFVVTSIVITPW